MFKKNVVAKFCSFGNYVSLNTFVNKISMFYRDFNHTKLFSYKVTKSNNGSLRIQMPDAIAGNKELIVHHSLIDCFYTNLLCIIRSQLSVVSQYDQWFLGKKLNPVSLSIFILTLNNIPEKFSKEVKAIFEVVLNSNLYIAIVTNLFESKSKPDIVDFLIATEFILPVTDDQFVEIMFFHKKEFEKLIPSNEVTTYSISGNIKRCNNFILCATDLAELKELFYKTIDYTKLNVFVEDYFYQTKTQATNLVKSKINHVKHKTLTLNCVTKNFLTNIINSEQQIASTKQNAHTVISNCRYSNPDYDYYFEETCQCSSTLCVNKHM